MKTYLRIIALVMALLTVAGMAVACADSVDPETSTAPDAAETTPAPGVIDSEPAETDYALDKLKESYNFGETITFFILSDWTMREFYADESGDVIDDAIFNRNVSVETRLGVEFEYVEEKGLSSNYTTWITKAENDWAADNTFDIYAGYSRSAPLMTLKGMTANLLEYDESFFVDMPWWPQALTTECTINDKLYFCSGDISTNLLWMMIGTFYNKELYEQNFAGEKTPMDMVEDNEWTMEKMFSMAKDIYEDDGNGKRDESDKYGHIIYDVNIDAFQTSAGVTSIEKDEENGLRISQAWNSQRCADACALVGEYVKSDGVLFKDATSIRNIFYEERALFITDRLFIVAGKDSHETGKIEFSYGLVPQPKFSTDQDMYLTNVGHPFVMYAVNSQSKKLESAVTTLEALGSANHRTVTPAVFEVAMKVRYTDDPQTSSMYDTLREGISFDIGRLYAETFKNGTANIFRTTAKSANPSGLLSNIKKNQKIFENAIKTIMDFYNT